jgi:hypothetical protein
MISRIKGSEDVTPSDTARFGSRRLVIPWIRNSMERVARTARISTGPDGVVVT